MDAEVRELVARRLQSPLKIEVVRFFVNSFSPLSTAAGISLWLGVSTEALAPPLEELARDGLLTRCGEGQAAVFSLAPAAQGSEPLSRLLDLYDDDVLRGEVLALMDH
jgi:hypothetical protein